MIFARKMSQSSMTSARDLEVTVDLQQHHFPLDALAFAKVDHLDDIDELVELLDDLIEHPVILGIDDKGHPGNLRIMARADVQRVNVEAAAAEHPGDTRARTPNLFSTRTEMVCRCIEAAGQRPEKGRLHWTAAPWGQPEIPDGPIGTGTLDILSEAVKIPPP